HLIPPLQYMPKMSLMRSLKKASFLMAKLEMSYWIYTNNVSLFMDMIVLKHVSKSGTSVNIPQVSVAVGEITMVMVIFGQLIVSRCGIRTRKRHYYKRKKNSENLATPAFTIKNLEI